MKKLFFAVCLVLTAGLLFTSESPSLDGRAVVADEGVFPKGLFAKTVGYLPGDSISVTNPVNGERVEILVIGSLDPSDGVAVLLSPEAASALHIRKNSNNLVKLTKRTGASDEIVNGSAVLTNESGDYEAAEEGDKTIAQVVEEAVENNVPVEEAVAEAVEKAEEEVADKAFDAVDEQIAEAEGETPAEGEEETVAVAEEGEEGEQPVYEELVVDELAESEEGEESDDFVEADVIDAPVEEAELAAESEAEPEAAEAEPVDEYEAIVLVPSESRAPEAVEPEVSEIPEPLPVEEETVVISEPEPAPVARSAAGVAYVNGYGDLAEQKYYVQIAVYNKAENVEQIAALYGNRYPITVVQQGAKSPVLVGPLNVDEYGVVLERFRSYGFKDAFVRHR